MINLFSGVATKGRRKLKLVRRKVPVKVKFSEIIIYVLLINISGAACFFSRGMDAFSDARERDRMNEDKRC